MTLQEQLMRVLSSVPSVAAVMNTSWAWPLAESVHFIGVCLLFGTVGMFDLRLIGVAASVPVAAFQRLLPFGLVGFALAALSGTAFLLSEPDQYVFNSAFHFKVLFMGLAALNAVAFQFLAAREIFGTPDGAHTTPRGRFFGAVSLCLWIAVLVCGRLLTFYRPGDCANEAPAFLATCF